MIIKLGGWGYSFDQLAGGRGPIKRENSKITGGGSKRYGWGQIRCKDLYKPCVVL